MEGTILLFKSPGLSYPSENNLPIINLSHLKTTELDNYPSPLPKAYTPNKDPTQHIFNYPSNPNSKDKPHQHLPNPPPSDNPLKPSTDHSDYKFPTNPSRRATPT